MLLAPLTASHSQGSLAMALSSSQHLQELSGFQIHVSRFDVLVVFEEQLLLRSDVEKLLMCLQQS